MISRQTLKTVRNEIHVNNFFLNLHKRINSLNAYDIHPFPTHVIQIHRRNLKKAGINFFFMSL